MTQRIAPNNTLPATHFIEVWRGIKGNAYQGFIMRLSNFSSTLDGTRRSGCKTIAIFRIRENKLPTLHNFKSQTTQSK